MNTQRTVFNKIAQFTKKEELASEKVELSLAEDIKENIKYFKGIFDNIENEGAKLGTALADAIYQKRNLEDFVKRALSFKNVANKTIANFKKAADELGVEANSPDVRALEAAIKQADEYVKFFNSIPKIPQV